MRPYIYNKSYYIKQITMVAGLYALWQINERLALHRISRLEQHARFRYNITASQFLCIQRFAYKTRKRILRSEPPILQYIHLE